MKTKLTIEESAKLIELGVDPKLASKCKITYDENVKPIKHPIFDLSDVIEALPKQIPYPKPNRLQILYPFTKGGEIMVRYATFDEEMVQVGFCAPELIDVLNQLLIRYITNGHYNPKVERNEKA